MLGQVERQNSVLMTLSLHFYPPSDYEAIMWKGKNEYYSLSICNIWRLNFAPCSHSPTGMTALIQQQLRLQRMIFESRNNNTQVKKNTLWAFLPPVNPSGNPIWLRVFISPEALALSPAHSSRALSRCQSAQLAPPSPFNTMKWILRICFIWISQFASFLQLELWNLSPNSKNCEKVILVRERLMSLLCIWSWTKESDKLKFWRDDGV